MSTERTASLIVPITLGISLVSASVPAFAEPPAPLEPADETLLNLRSAGAVFAMVSDRHIALPLSKGSLVTAESLGPALGGELRRWLPTRDGWGRPLRVLAVDEFEFALISFGADGEPDVPYQRRIESGEAFLGGTDSDPSSPDRDIIFAGSDFLQRPEPPEPPWMRAMADLRAIGTAIESFAVDESRYPGPTPGLALVGDLAPDLEPTYIRTLPRVDPWGRPYYVWSTESAYLIASGGADGRLDREYGADDVPAEPADGKGTRTDDPDADIVFANGRFVVYPAAAKSEVSQRVE